jgi:hypothetical protein
MRLGAKRRKKPDAEPESDPARGKCEQADGQAHRWGTRPVKSHQLDAVNLY